MINEFQPMNHLSRLQNFICTIGNLPTSYVLSMSYEEQVWWLCNFLETKIFPAIENNTEITEETQKAFLELQQYVTDYFNNLDVQDEINNKLDEMAESGILETLLQNKFMAKFIFPKFWENATNGDTSLINYKNKNIMIDTYTSAQWTNVKQMLIDNNISHIDVLIITHYHSDHVGNFENLYNEGYIDNTTQLFMPGEAPTRFGYDTQINYYKTFCQNHNLNYYVPYNNEILNIDDNFKITFTNCDASLYDSYYPLNEQNQVSTICMVEYKQFKALFTGDAYASTEDFLMSTNFVKSKIDLYKIPHHAINVLCRPIFLQTLKPDYAVQIGGMSRYTVGEFANSGETKILNSFGTKIYSTYMNDDYIQFETDGYIMNNIKGKSFNGSNGRVIMDFYVDINASKNQIQNGTQHHPFSEISQAISEISSIPFIDEANIHVADGDYAYSALNANYPLSSEYNRVNIYNSNTIIRIIGNSNDSTKVVINGILAKKSNISLEYLTIDNDNHNDALYFDKCKVDMSHINIISKNNTTHNNGIYSRNSNISATNINIDYCNIGFNLNYNSILYYNTCTFGSHNENSKVLNNSSILEKNFTYSNSSDKYKDLKHYNDYIVPTLLYANNQVEFSATEFPLNVNPRDFRCIEIEYEDVHGRIGTSGKITFPQSHWIDIFTFHATANDIFETGVSVQLQTDKFTYNMPYTKTTNKTSKEITINDDRNISITRIFGYFEDVVNDLR